IISLIVDQGRSRTAEAFLLVSQPVVVSGVIQEEAQEIRQGLGNHRRSAGPASTRGQRSASRTTITRGRRNNGHLVAPWHSRRHRRRFARGPQRNPLVVEGVALRRRRRRSASKAAP